MKFEPLWSFDLGDLRRGAKGFFSKIPFLKSGQSKPMKKMSYVLALSSLFSLNFYLIGVLH